MSFDLILLKPKSTLKDITNLDDINIVDELGSSDEVYSYLSEYFPGCSCGIWKSNEGFSIEFSNYKDNSKSIHLSLKYGEIWNENSSAYFMNTIKNLCTVKGWVAFLVQDNSRLA